MKVQLLLAAFVALIHNSISECIPGLRVHNASGFMLAECNGIVDPRSLREEPIVYYTKGNVSETYLIMLLEVIPAIPDRFRLHWLVGGVKYNPRDTSLQTKFDVYNFNLGYVPLSNLSRYEVRLYNMTGRTVWGSVGVGDINTFQPSQWVSKFQIPPVPLAKTDFEVKMPGAINGFIPMHYDPQSNPPNPVFLPNYPTAPVQPRPPNQVQPGQQVPYPSQSLPVPQPQPPSLPYPNQSVPKQLPYNPSYITYNTHHPVQNQYYINTTIFRRCTPEMKGNNILYINSTRYSSDFYNKNYKLTPYLIIDNKSYIWRNLTHFPGNGKSLYINETQYVPYTPPSNEVHHHHYHKNSASTNPSTFILFTIFIPLFYLVSYI